MATDISNIRTMQDVINVLSVVYFNMNEIERIYYDMFINPIPLDVTFQRYNDEGVLETITLPNRAKASFNVLTGEGSPQGVVEGSPGALYLDLSAGNMYFKTTGTDAYGWAMIWNNANLRKNVDFLAPDGDASQLTNLNMSNAGAGTLAVLRGGTGSNGLTGLVKGNGTSPYTAAIDGVDYLGPNSMTGLIAYYPISNIPSGWLRCDGSAYSRTTYARLYEIIGTSYGAGDGSTTFNVPDLYNYYIRCWDGSSVFNTVQAGQVGGHTHSFSGSTGSSGSNHTHTRGDMEITGSFCGINADPVSGAFSVDSKPRGGWDNDGYRRVISFAASRSWTGSTSSASSSHTHSLSGSIGNNNPGGENRVVNKMLVPVIKY